MNKVVLPPLPGYADLSESLGPVTANLLCVTRWKDGIDIEEPDAALIAFLRARDLEVVRVVLEAAAKVLTEHQIPVGNSAAGELACQWTYDALKECRDTIKSLEFKHAE